MSEYVRASAIPGPKETLVRGVGATEGDGDGTAKQGGSRIWTTGQVGFGDGESGLGVGAEGAVLEGRDAKSYGSKVGDNDGVFEDDGTGLAVKEGWGVLCATESTRLATLEAKLNS